MDPKTRKEVLRKLHYGVYVATTKDGEEHAAALITWVSQASLTPPLVMLALRKDSGIYALLRRTGRGVVHILSQGQKGLAADFFKPTRVEGDRMNGHPFRLENGLPVLTEIPWYFHFEAREWAAGGDHGVLVAEVVGVGKNAEAEESLCLRETGWSYGG